MFQFAGPPKAFLWPGAKYSIGSFLGGPFHSLKFPFVGPIKPGTRGKLSPLHDSEHVWPCIRLENLRGEFWYVSQFFHLAQSSLARQQGQGKYFLDVSVNSHHVHNVLVHYINANFPSNY